MKRLQSQGFSCKQAEEDADADSIKTSIEIARDTNKTVIVVGPIQTKNNIGDEDGDGLEDFEDLLESGKFVESNDEEMPPKRHKVMDK
ncbi:unnamed protein product [Arctia plantaginis]|uniref:Uncharacterized protein n=1 Tax=Arctia plantaginis TaxID=874455 RepID=A0A8S1AUK8_ARCPL|nr:unnamed protein product [Arctia plantaginis]